MDESFKVAQLVNQEGDIDEKAFHSVRMQKKTETLKKLVEERADLNITQKDLIKKYFF